jgi:hypothetical protein
MPLPVICIAPVICTVNPVTTGPDAQMPLGQRSLAIHADPPAAASSRVTQGMPAAAGRECHPVPAGRTRCHVPAFALARRTARSHARQSPAPECRYHRDGCTGHARQATTYCPVTLRIDLSSFPLNTPGRRRSRCFAFLVPMSSGSAWRPPFSSVTARWPQHSRPGRAARQPLVRLIRDQPGGCRSASTWA